MGAITSQHWLARKHQRSFGHRPDIAGEAEFRKVVEELVADVSEYWMAAQIRDFIRREIDVFEKLERLLESGGDQIISSRRKMANE